MQFPLQNVILARKSIVLRNIYGKIISYRFRILETCVDCDDERRKWPTGFRYLDRECSEAKPAEKGVRFNPPVST